MPLNHSAAYDALLSGDELPSNLAAIPVLLHLQYLCGQTHRWKMRGTTRDQGTHELPDVLSGLQGLSIVAKAAGFGGFAALCLRVYGQFEQLCPDGRVSNSAAQLLVGWTHHADRYLRKPSSRTLIATLVSQLGAAAWASPLPAREQDRFIHEMLAPFA
ncbi:MAG: hypothetical protein ABSE43_14460 [Steroidobacteraceae bacterium]|jgi:hypothetical protein